MCTWRMLCGSIRGKLDLSRHMLVSIIRCSCKERYQQWSQPISWLLTGADRRLIESNDGPEGDLKAPPIRSLRKPSLSLSGSLEIHLIENVLEETHCDPKQN